MARKTKTGKASVEAKLKAMMHALEERPVPDTIRSVVDQFDDGEPKESPAKAKGRKRG
jgi:hypothetical protein